MLKYFFGVRTLWCKIELEFCATASQLWGFELHFFMLSSTFRQLFQNVIVSKSNFTMFTLPTGVKLTVAGLSAYRDSLFRSCLPLSAAYQID